VIRLLDLFISITSVILLLPLLLVICVIGLFDTGKPIFIQKRLGRNHEIFNLIKFRTMSLNTVSVGTHEVHPSAITSLGKFLRKSKIDELPQLINVIIGDMSLVGPRPCLPTQDKVIKARDTKNVFSVRPGVTGLAQINKIDMSTPILLASTDNDMITNYSIKSYFYYIVLTIMGRGGGDRVKE